MLPNQTEPPATDCKDSPPVVDSIDVDVANKDEGEAASELEGRRTIRPILAPQLARSACPASAAGPYESVFDVAALEAAAGVEQLRRDRRRLPPNSRPFRRTSRHRRPAAAATRPFLRRRHCRQWSETPTTGSGRLHPMMMRLRVKLNWLDDSSRWPDALDKLRRQLAALLKAQSATSKDSGAMPAAAPRPHWPPWCSSAARPGRWNFAVASVRVAGSSGRLHLAATWHGGLLVAEGSASATGPSGCLPSLLTGTRVLLLLLIRQPKHCLCCFFVRSEEQIF
uniref:Uncharacterized protein n=1 Tax=Macrostomum lignano TaxID=282301 RepID=A0A1I8F8Z7_9PLAT